METNAEATTDRITYAACANCLRVNKIAIDRPPGKTPVCGACKTAIDVHGAVVNASTQQLQKIMKSSPIPVVTDFWAPWCGPCRAFAPTFERAADELAGRAVFAKVNTEENTMASQAFGIRGIPTLIAFRGGIEIGRQSGALPFDHFKRWVEDLVR